MDYGIEILNQPPRPGIKVLLYILITIAWPPLLQKEGKLYVYNLFKNGSLPLILIKI